MLLDPWMIQLLQILLLLHDFLVLYIKVLKMKNDII